MAKFKDISRKEIRNVKKKMIKNDKITAWLRMRCCHGNGLNPENETEQRSLLIWVTLAVNFVNKIAKTK